MEQQVWLPLLSGLIGAMIGGAASVLTVLVQSRHETKRHRLGMLSDLAMQEVERAYAVIKDAGQRGSVPPPVLYMHFYDRVLDLLESGAFSLERYRKIADDNDEFLKLIFEIDALRRAEPRKTRP